MEAIRIHQGISGNVAREQALESLKKVRIPAPTDVINYYPHQLSGGMRQRVLIAVAISCQPDLLIADEPTTALDVTIQAQIMKLLSGIRKELNSAMMLITHDLGLVAEYCDRAYVMYAGRIVEECDIFALFESPMHPYSKALLKSSLSVDHRVETFETIEGQPPSLIYLPSGCRFHPRCGQAMDRCTDEEPPVFYLSNNRCSRCWLHEGSG
jgi:oligopeptide/dipeptide ABC transporter ATP-binding protein